MNWDGAELSFFQKVALIDGPHGPCEKNGMLPALRRLNRIRNEFAHNLNATLSKSDVEPMFQVKIGGKILVNSAKIEPIKILEMFAHFACAYFAGILYATAKEAGLPILFDGKPIGPVDK